MPSILYCPADDGRAWLFTLMTNETYDGGKTYYEVYNTELNLQAAKNWLILDHLEECSMDEADHKVLTCWDPFEQRG